MKAAELHVGLLHVEGPVRGVQGFWIQISNRPGILDYQNRELILTQDVSKCEKILEMKKIDFSRSLSISKSTKIPMDSLVTGPDILS